MIIASLQVIDYSPDGTSIKTVLAEPFADNVSAREILRWADQERRRGYHILGQVNIQTTVDIYI